MLVVLLNTLGAAIGGFVGYTLMVLLLNALNPGYKTDYIKGAAASALVGFIGGIIGELGQSSRADVGLMTDVSLTALANTFMRSLAQTGVGGLSKAAGLGFWIGMLMGAYSAALEFFMSDTYSNNLARAFDGV